MSLRPIFIGGCERSGTTMLGALLGGAPGAITVPESPFRQSGMRALARGKTPAEALRRMTGHEKFGPWRVPESLDEGGLGEKGFDKIMSILVRRYARVRSTETPTVWIDHTPSNMRLGRHSAQWFPDARFVHIVRDGRGVAASIIPLAWGPNTVENAARYWVERLAYGLALEGSALAQQAMRVRYEDLVLTPEATLRQVCDFCALEFDPTMLDGGRFDVPGITTHQHGLVGKPPEKSRATAWRVALTSREIEIFESQAGEMLELLGYPLDYGLTATPPRRSERASAAAIEWTRTQLANPWRKWKRRRTLLDRA